jgi:hypothetical protein
VAVLKRSMAISRLVSTKSGSESLARSIGQPLGRVDEADDDDEEVKPVELYYSTASNTNMDDLTPIVLNETEEE